MNKINSDIANNIKKYRKLNNMTQKDLASKVGVSIAAVSNWETGANSIDIDTLFKVCEVLDIPISVMTVKETDWEMSRLEKEIILKFREADNWDKLTVLKTLNVTHLPSHLLEYVKRINRMYEDKK